MIPRTLHQIWFGPPMPDHLARYRQAWIDLHPDWEHRLWTEENLPTLRNQDLYDRADQIAPGSVGQLRADLARYEILLDHGGVYADLDMEPLRPIDRLLNVEAFAGWEEPRLWINNAILGAVPGHPFLHALVAGLPGWVATHVDPGRVRPNVLSGPQYLTPVWRKHAETVVVFPRRMFYPYLYREVGTAAESRAYPDSWTIHHWHNTRTRRRIGPAQPRRT